MPAKPIYTGGSPLYNAPEPSVPNATPDPNQFASRQEPEKHKVEKQPLHKNKKALNSIAIIVAAIVIAAMLIGFAFLILNRDKPDSFTPQPSPTTQAQLPPATPAPIPLNSIYEGDALGFKFNYPQAMIVSEPEDGVVRVTKDQKFDIILSILSLPAQDSQSLTEIAENENVITGSIDSYQSGIISGVTFKSESIKYVYFKDNDRIIKFGLSGTNGEETLDQILATFEFTN